LLKEYLSSGNLVEEIFGKEIHINDETYYNKVILAPRNEDVILINKKILDKINMPSKTYLSIDTINTYNFS